MILVTGATGTLGSHLLYYLLQTNEKIVALKRISSNLDNVKKTFSFYTQKPDILFDKIIWRDADITNFVSLENVFDDIDEIYHCAAYVSFSNQNQKFYYDTNVIGTRNIVNLALEFNIKKLCYVSSIAALGVNKNDQTTETDLLNLDETKSYYSISKYYAELEVWRAINEGLNAVIVNPSIILAPYIFDKKNSIYIKLILNKGIKYYTCGKKGYVDVFDVVETMTKLMNQNIFGDRFIISSENISFKYIFIYINKALGKNSKQKKVSKRTLIFLKYLLKILTFNKSPLNDLLIYYATNDELYSNKKILSSINHDFKKIKQSISEIISIYISLFSL